MNTIEVSLPTDKNGYIGRECHYSDCHKYFKILLKDDIFFLYCPYCGKTDTIDNFHTDDQQKYALSIAEDKIIKTFGKMIEQEFNQSNRKRSSSIIGFDVQCRPGPKRPIRYYYEIDLETYIECSNCSLNYAVYGVFAYCPKCGTHNSLQILRKGMDIVLKQLELADGQEEELYETLIRNSLDNCVASLDGFGREVTKKYPTILGSYLDNGLSFQNIESARSNVKNHFNIDFASDLSQDEWDDVIDCFQKRHLCVHKMGVIDQKYIDASGNKDAKIGKKLS